MVGLSTFIAALVAACTPIPEAKLHSSELSRPLTVAFIGDQGSGDGARAVLQLIKAEGAEMVLHQAAVAGDLELPVYLLEQGVDVDVRFGIDDPKVVRKYYETLIELAESSENHAPASLGSFVGPVFWLAQQRSARSDPVAENRSAILALAMYFSSLHFERFIGPVRSGEVLLHRPSIQKVRLAGRKDLAVHFITSAGLKIVANSGVSLAVGEFKELLDSGGGSGFSFADLAAGRAGIRFAEVATDSKRARKLQSLLQGLPDEALFFPTIKDLPEGLSQAAFEQIYGNIESPLYKAMVNEIDRRISETAMETQT